MDWACQEVGGCLAILPRNRIQDFSQRGFLNNSIERKTIRALRSRHQALLHRLRLQEIGSFRLWGDLTPQSDGNDDITRFPGMVGGDLDVRIRYNFNLRSRHNRRD